MNNLSSHHDHIDELKAGKQPALRFGKHHVQHWVVYSVFGGLAAVLFMLISYLGISYEPVVQPSSFSELIMQEPVFAHAGYAQTEKLISKLKHYGLWKIPASSKVPRLFIKSYPPDLKNVGDISVRKKVFLNSLLPHALFVRQETMQRRSRFQSILNKIDCADDTLDFGNDPVQENQCSWKDFLVEKEVDFIQDLCRDYRATSAEILLRRVDAIPISLILAQGALESSWGSSRFTREGNSIFGMWTWRTAGMVPSQREEGKNHKVKIYDNILESVRAYHLTLNRLEPYKELRQLRLYSDNPLILAEGLKLYSERGDEYVEDIKNVILSNDLQKYDSCTLADFDLPEFNGPVSGLSTPAEPGRVSL